VKRGVKPNNVYTGSNNPVNNRSKAGLKLHSGGFLPPGAITIERTRLPMYHGEPMMQYIGWIRVNEPTPELETTHIMGQLHERVGGPRFHNQARAAYPHLQQLQDVEYKEFTIYACEPYALREIRNRTVRNLAIIQMDRRSQPIVDAARAILHTWPKYMDWQFSYIISPNVTLWRDSDGNDWQYNLREDRLEIRWT
jgi:hypothetical protein